jgi:hypothetical protein
MDGKAEGSCSAVLALRLGAMGIMDIGAGKSGASSELILHQGLMAATTGDRIVSKVSEQHLLPETGVQ